MKKMRCVLFACSCLTLPSFAEVTVKVAGIQVIRETYGKSEYGAELSPLSGQVGSEIGLLILSEKGGIIGLDERKSSLSVFSDDQGGNLQPEKKFFGPFSFPKASQDGKALSVGIKTDKTPKAGAQKMKVKGELMVKIGTEKKTHQGEVFDLSKESEQNVGGLKIKVSKLEKANFGNAGFEFEIKSKGDLSQIASIQFSDAQGKKIETDKNGSSSFGDGKMTQWTRSYRLKKKEEKVRLEIELWDNLKTVSVPLDLEFGIGLSK